MRTFPKNCPLAYAFPLLASKIVSGIGLSLSGFRFDIANETIVHTIYLILGEREYSQIKTENLS